MYNFGVDKQTTQLPSLIAVFIPLHGNINRTSNEFSDNPIEDCSFMITFQAMLLDVLWGGNVYTWLL